MRTYKYFDNVKKNAVFTEQACQFVAVRMIV